jgi:hypothetical protein
MERNFTTLMEKPENGNVIASLIYEFLAFYTLPFLLLLAFNGTYKSNDTAALMEILYHAVNFSVAVFIYREYLTDTFADIRYQYKKLLKASAQSIELILLISLVLFFSLGFGNMLAAHGSLPLAEVDLLVLPSSIILSRPLLGVICMVVLTPVAISCLFYGTVFAPICYTRPVLAYLAMALFLAFPRYCNAATFWEASSQWTLYFTQLPVHLLACRSYQKADSIWAPILTLSAVNAISCILLFVGRFLGFL